MAGMSPWAALFSRCLPRHLGFVSGLVHPEEARTGCCRSCAFIGHQYSLFFHYYSLFKARCWQQRLVHLCSLSHVMGQGGNPHQNGKDLGLEFCAQ